MASVASNVVHGNKLLKLEAVRGLAALYVVAHHTIHVQFPFYGIDLGRLLRFGQEAVILFFLVSGFVIHFSYQSTRDRSFRTYFIKRFVRIYIPLLSVFLLGFIVESYNSGAVARSSFWQVIGNVLMLQDWPSDKPGVLFDPLYGNNPLWSLAYEWWFYMLYFPLINTSMKFTRLSKIVFLTSTIASAVYVFWPNIVPRIITYFAIWWSGVYLAEFYLSRKKIDFKQWFIPIAALGIISIILLCKVIWWMQVSGSITLGRHPLIEVRHTLFAAVAIALAFVWHRCHWIGFDRLIGPFVIFAPISYVMYISHYHLMVAATWFDSAGHPVLIWVYYFLGLLIFSWAVELKFYPWVRQRIATRFIKY